MVEVTRINAGYNPEPTYGIIDSQTIQIVYSNAYAWWFTCCKSANLHDTKAGLFVAINAYRNYPTIQKFSGDGGYRGSFEFR